MELRILIWAVTVFYMGLQDGTLATNDKIHITYTVENTLNVAPLFSGTLTMKTTSQAFYNIMQEADDMNTMFRFVSVQRSWGQYITTVNGLEASVENELFWAFLLRDKDGADCLLPLGVSKYVPSHGEHVVLSYQYYSIFNELPTCHGGEPHPDV